MRKEKGKEDRQADLLGTVSFIYVRKQGPPSEDCACLYLPIFYCPFESFYFCTFKNIMSFLYLSETILNVVEGCNKYQKEYNKWNVKYFYHMVLSYPQLFFLSHLQFFSVCLSPQIDNKQGEP